MTTSNSKPRVSKFYTWWVCRGEAFGYRINAGGDTPAAAAKSYFEYKKSLEGRMDIRRIPCL
jgi:hypothetical protein